MRVIHHMYGSDELHQSRRREGQLTPRHTLWMGKTCKSDYRGENPTGHHPQTLKVQRRAPCSRRPSYFCGLWQGWRWAGQWLKRAAFTREFTSSPKGAEKSCCIKEACCHHHSA